MHAHAYAVNMAAELRPAAHSRRGNRTQLVILVVANMLVISIGFVLYFNWTMFARADFFYPVIWALLVALVLWRPKAAIVAAFEWYCTSNITLWQLVLEVCWLPVENVRFLAKYLWRHYRCSEQWRKFAAPIVPHIDRLRARFPVFGGIVRETLMLPRGRSIKVDSAVRAARGTSAATATPGGQRPLTNPGVEQLALHEDTVQPSPRNGVAEPLLRHHDDGRQSDARADGSGGDARLDAAGCPPTGGHVSFSGVPDDAGNNNTADNGRSGRYQPSHSQARPSFSSMDSADTMDTSFETDHIEEFGRAASNSAAGAAVADQPADPLHQQHSEHDEQQSVDPRIAHSPAQNGAKTTSDRFRTPAALRGGTAAASAGRAGVGASLQKSASGPASAGGGTTSLMQLLSPSGSVRTLGTQATYNTLGTIQSTNTDGTIPLEEVDGRGLLANAILQPSQRVSHLLWMALFAVYTVWAVWVYRMLVVSCLVLGLFVWFASKSHKVCRKRSATYQWLRRGISWGFDRVVGLLVGIAIKTDRALLSLPSLSLRLGVVLASKCLDLIGALNSAVGNLLKSMIHSITAVLLIVTLLVVGVGGVVVWSNLVMEEWSTAASDTRTGMTELVNRAPGTLGLTPLQQESILDLVRQGQALILGEQHTSKSSAAVIITATPADSAAPTCTGGGSSPAAAAYGSSLDPNTSVGAAILADGSVGGLNFTDSPFDAGPASASVSPASSPTLVEGDIAAELLDSLNITGIIEQGLSWLTDSWPNETAVLRSIWQLYQEYNNTITAANGANRSVTSAFKPPGQVLEDRDASSSGAATATSNATTAAPPGQPSAIPAADRPPYNNTCGLPPLFELRDARGQPLSLWQMLLHAMRLKGISTFAPSCVPALLEAMGLWHPAEVVESDAESARRGVGGADNATDQGGFRSYLPFQSNLSTMFFDLLTGISGFAFNATDAPDGFAASNATGSGGTGIGNSTSVIANALRALGLGPRNTTVLYAQIDDLTASLSCAIPLPSTEALFTSSGAIISFFSRAASLVVTYAISASASVLSFVIAVTLFLNLLYYLLAAERDWLTSALDFLPSNDAAHVQEVLSSTVRQVFIVNVKVSTYHALFTFFVLRVAGVHFVYTCTALSGIGAVIPFFPTFLIGFPAAIELAVVRGQILLGVVLFMGHVGLLSYADWYLYESSSSVHPSVLGLAIIAGSVTFGPQGAVIGPLLVSVLLTCYILITEQIRVAAGTDRKFGLLMTPAGASRGSGGQSGDADDGSGPTPLAPQQRRDRDQRDPMLMRRDSFDGFGPRYGYGGGEYGSFSGGMMGQQPYLAHFQRRRTRSGDSFAHRGRLFSGQSKLSGIGSLPRPRNDSDDAASLNLHSNLNSNGRLRGDGIEYDAAGHLGRPLPAILSAGSRSADGSGGAVSTISNISFAKSKSTSVGRHMAMDGDGTPGLQSPSAATIGAPSSAPRVPVTQQRNRDRVVNGDKTATRTAGRIAAAAASNGHARSYD